ncbi:MAG: MMPL family transporter [Acidobacteriota bacterium]
MHGPSPLRRLHPLWRLALDRPVAVVLPIVLLAIWAAFEARHLRLDASIDLLADDDPIAVADAERQELFGPDSRLIVGLFRPADEGGVLQSASLQALRALHDELAAIEGIAVVSSLADAPLLVDMAARQARWTPNSSPEAQGSNDPADRAGYPILDDDALADPDLVRWRLHTSKVQRLLLLSMRESLTPLFVELEADADEAEVVDRVLSIARRFESEHAEAGRVLVAGAAVVETRLAEHVFDDLAGLVPFSIAWIACGILLLLRRFVFLGVALAHTLVLEALILGTMAVAGWSVNLVSVLAPVILVPIGVADLLHLLIRLRRAERAAAVHGDPTRLLRDSVGVLEAPMVATTLTTAIGFLGFLLSPVPAIQQFGLTLAGGAVLALLLTLSFDIALLRLLWRPRQAQATQDRPATDERWLTMLLRPRPRLVAACLGLVLCGGVGALAAATVPRLTIEDTWIRNFDPGSRVLYDTHVLESELFGTNLLALTFTGRPLAGDDPEAPARRALAAAHRLSIEHLVSVGVRGLVSPTLLVDALDPDQVQPWIRRPPRALDSFRQGVDTWTARGMTLPAIDDLVDLPQDRLQVQVMVLNQRYADLQATVDRIETAARFGSVPGVDVQVSGHLVTNLRMVESTVRGQQKALVLLLAVVGVLLVVVARSAAVGLALATPMLLAIAGSFALLILLDWPYGIALSMFPTLVVGLSVDFALHLHAALTRRGASTTEWVRDLATVLRGIAWNGILWSSGFALLAASTLPPNRALGLLCGLVVALSTVFTVVLLPMLLGLQTTRSREER